MEVLFTVAGGGDVWLDADPATPFGLLAEALDGQSGESFHQAWWDQTRLLETGRNIGSQVLDGAVLSHRPAPGPTSFQAEPAGVLRCISGPHAGDRWPLPVGRHLIGRSDEATVNLVRDRMVSRRHATLEVTSTGAAVADEGSAHGLTLDGQIVSGGDLSGGGLLQVGATVLAWETHDRPRPAVVVPDGEGGLVFNRPPRMLNPTTGAMVRYPGPAPVRSGVNFPLMATIAPVILGVVLAVALHQVAFLLFTMLAPVIGVSNYVTQRRSGVKSHRERLKAHQEAHSRATTQLATAVTEETARRREDAPDAATLAAVASGPESSLWQRRRDDADFMQLRMGLGDRPAAILVEGANPSAEGPQAVVRQVPVVVDLQRDGVLGIAGERRSCEALASALLVQAAVLHAPDDLVITILTGPHQADRWGWARWLPHVRGKDGRCVARIGTTDATVARLAGELSSLIDERLTAKTGGPDNERDRPPAHLVVVDGAYQLGAVPAVTKILRRGPEAGVMAVCLDDAERLLPEECHAVAVLDPARPAGLHLRTGRGTQTVEALADLVDPDTAEPISRALAPIRLNRRVVGGASIPTSVRLLTQISLEPPTAEAVAAGWRAADRSTSAVIGEAETGPMVVDLARDGPHGLVAGTTGSGKSELLQTLIASLAVANRPDLLNFVLVDYKGGSAFKDCARLPHTVGMVTDLDGHLTERALASIGAELRRREVLLAEVGAKDLEGYWRAAPADIPPVARLLIVIDEFASLVEELPSFVDGLVDLARRGRSLGIHLILATQRPSGVVSAAIKTNTNLRVAMRVTDTADSLDVIDSPLAARIPKGLPGRGYARVGHEDLSEFQAARIGGRRPLGGGPAMRIEAVGWDRLGEVLAGAAGPALSDDTTDLAELVGAIRQAAEAERISPSASPWLPALAEDFVLPTSSLGEGEGAGGVPPLAAVFGVEDLPADQAQRPATYDLTRDGHLLIIGDPGSGRSTLLRSLAASLAARVSTAEVHVFGIDCGNGALSPLESFPQVGAVVSRREPERVDRLLAKLLAETTARQQLLAKGGFATIADQRRSAPPEERLPYIVVLLDRWEGFNAEFDAADGGRLVSEVMHLMREGQGAGIKFVVTADRSGTSPRFSSLAERIVMLRLNDRTVYSILGLNPRHLPDHVPPGRGFYARGGTEIQVGLLDEDPAGPAQVAALERLARATRDRDRSVPDSQRPDPIATLPFHVSLTQTLAQSPPGPDGAALIGVGGDRLTAQYLDLAVTGPGFVVVGPPRSGRSNTLMAVARSVTARGGRVLAITCRPSPLSGLSGTAGVAGVLDGPSVSAADLGALLAEVGPTGLTILVDDAELLADAPLGETLASFVRTGRDCRSALVLGGTTGEMNQFRGFIPETRKSKAGLLLCPTTVTDGDVVAVRLPRTAVFAGPPGRGVLVVGGGMTLVQVPFDDFV